MMNRVNLVGTAVHYLLVLLGTEEGASDCGLHGQVATLGSVGKVRVKNLDSRLADVGRDESPVHADKTTVIAYFVAFVAGNCLPLFADVLVDNCVNSFHVYVEHVVDSADSLAITAFAGNGLQVGGHLFGHCNRSIG